VAGQFNPRIDQTSFLNPFYPTMKDFNRRSLEFNDSPRRICRSHPDCISWRAELYPVAWDGLFDITIYDGIRWGFDLECVPEPSLVALMSIGVAMILIMRCRVERRS
jgi:hypothetical protein